MDYFMTHEQHNVCLWVLKKQNLWKKKCINLPNTRFSLYLCLDKIQYPYEQYGENETCLGKKIKIIIFYYILAAICYVDVVYKTGHEKDINEYSYSYF